MRVVKAFAPTSSRPGVRPPYVICKRTISVSGQQLTRSIQSRPMATMPEDAA